MIKKIFVLFIIIFTIIFFLNNCKEDKGEWVRIPAGKFKKGDKKVYLSQYYIYRYEVTFDQYDEFCVATGRSKPSDEGWGRGNRPVINVSWYDAKAFCDWMSQKTGQNIHLPTQMQWEKAARGTDKRRYPWGNSDPNSRLCNYNENVGRTQPVGSYPSGVSPYGVHDMAGNVDEWCSDWYGLSFYYDSPYNNPTGPGSSYYRISRGGCWYSNEYRVLSIALGGCTKSGGSRHQGFRLARD